MSTKYVSTNFDPECPTATRQLGEAFPVIAAADTALDAAVDALRQVCRCAPQEADDIANELLTLLRDARKDSSWRTLVPRAKDAFHEAKVIPYRVPATAELRIVK